MGDEEEGEYRRKSEEKEEWIFSLYHHPKFRVL
jgi:hypothetical protein